MQKTSFQILKLLAHSQLCLYSHLSLRGASWNKPIINTNSITFERNERRGNLPSLINWREFLNGCETTSPRTQSREIASGIQQRLASLLFNTHTTKPRNDDLWWERGGLQTLQRGNVCGY